ncbi:MAG TPA: TetR/AcrR family transcriptional regulator [Streptosporangiaceae bacterium]|jgi:AcrR family transcriptional regulator
MKSGLRRAEKNEQTRRRLLNAARRLFVVHGFHGTSLDAIAEAAGFSKGAVYSQFDSKADVFLALLADRIDDRIAQIRSALGTGSVTGDVAATIRQWAAVLRTDLPWTLLVIEFRIHAARDSALNARYAELHARFRDAITEMVTGVATDAGLRSGEIADFVAGQLALGTGAALERAAAGEEFSDALTERLSVALAEGLQTPGGRPAHDT